MSLKIKGVNVVGNKITGDMFDVSVEIVESFGNPHVTKMVTLSRGDRKEIFANLVIRHPEFHTLNGENWVDLLVHELSISNNKDHIIPSGRVIENGVYRVTTKSNIGQRFLRFHGQGMDYVIVVDFGEKLRSMRGIKLSTIVDLSDDRENVDRILTIFHDKLNIRSYGNSKKDEYSRSIDYVFDEPLSAMDQLKIYLNYNISQVLHERAKKAVLSDQKKDQVFTWKEVFGFYYIQSQDGLIQISPWENTEVNLLWSVNRFLLNQGCDLIEKFRRDLINAESRSAMLFKSLIKLKAALLAAES